MKHFEVPKRLLSVAFLVGFLGSTGVVAAFAISSDWQDTGTVNGYSYENQATIEPSAAVTSVRTTNEVNAPAGYMGAWAGLYESNGTLCKQTHWIYTTSADYSMTLPTDGTYCGTGNYYSYGETKAYTGNGYDTYHTYMSPELGFS